MNSRKPSGALQVLRERKFLHSYSGYGDRADAQDWSQATRRKADVKRKYSLPRHRR